MMLESFLFGAGWTGLYVLWLVRRGRKSSSAAPQLPPKELPFRTMGTVDETWGAPRGLPTSPMGPLTACPRCGTKMRSCPGCNSGGTDRVIDASHEFAGKFCGYYHEVGYLNFTHGTSERHLCSPERRARYGFLWLKDCEEPGIHVHQKCERCAWRGIARIEKESVDG